MLQKQGVLEQTQDLSKEGDGLLVELLGVADVCGDDLLEWEIGVAPGKLGTIFLRLDGELATDGVLGLPDVRVDVVDIQPPCRCGRHCAIGGYVRPQLVRKAGSGRQRGRR